MPENHLDKTHNMDRSPRLIKIREQIAQICKDNDIGACIVLYEPAMAVEGKKAKEFGFTEFELVIDPSFSCVSHENNTLRVRAKAEDFGGDTEARDRMLYDTSVFLEMMTETLGIQYATLLHTSKKMQEVTGYKHPKSRIRKGK